MVCQGPVAWPGGHVQTHGDRSRKIGAVRIRAWASPALKKGHQPNVWNEVSQAVSRPAEVLADVFRRSWRDLGAVRDLGPEIVERAELYGGRSTWRRFEGG